MSSLENDFQCFFCKRNIGAKNGLCTNCFPDDQSRAVCSNCQEVYIPKGNDLREVHPNIEYNPGLGGTIAARVSACKKCDPENRVIEIRVETRSLSMQEV